MKTRSLVPKKEDQNPYVAVGKFGLISNYPGGNLHLNEAEAGAYRAANDEIAAWNETNIVSSPSG